MAKRPQKKQQLPIHHRILHHARRITGIQWQTPHLVIVVLVLLAAAFGGLYYYNSHKPAEVQVLGSPTIRPVASTTSNSTEFSVQLGDATVDNAALTGCDGSFNFVFPITSNGAGTATFQRMRSDGVVVDPGFATITFTKTETKYVTYQWKVDKSYEFNGYAYLQLLTPKRLASNYASFKFTYLCR